MGKKVPKQVTPATPQQMLEALGRAWMRLFNYCPTREQIAVLLAQWALETGNGASMICNNVGNARWTQGYPSDFCEFMTWEMVKGVHTNMLGAFRAFASLEDGCADYLGMMHTRFLRAWPAVEKGDPVLFAHVLKQLRYYTADEAVYAAGVKARFHTFVSLPAAQWELDAQAARERPTQPELAAVERITLPPSSARNDSEPPPTPKAA